MSAYCDCCASVNQYISEHLDRAGLVTHNCDPAETLATFQGCFPGEDLEITLKDVADYITSLSEKSNQI